MAMSNFWENFLGIDPKYDVKDLYVGVLVVIVRENRSIKFKLTERYIILQRKKYYESKFNEKNDIGWYGNYVGVDLFTGKEYVFAKGSNTHKQHWEMLCSNVGGMAIGNFSPLDILLDTPKITISKSELLEIFNKLNSREPKETPKEENTNVDITDAILKTIFRDKCISKKCFN